MFNVVIEKEPDLNENPLIIKEDINNIIQSIEEQLYNINVSYRNHVRKIKNSIKSLAGVTESTVILEDDFINDDNLIHYLTNVLEISLDCVISTLYEDKDFRRQLLKVSDLDDLLKIDHSNIKVCNQIIEQCKDLFNVYSEVNDKLISSISFYEILDESIKHSLTHNKQPLNINTQENEIYNRVIENLDNLIDEDLNSTYNNIKHYAAFISEARAPQPMPNNNQVPLPPNATRWDRFLNYFVDNANAHRILALIGIFTGTYYLFSRIVTVGYESIKNGIGWFDNFSSDINIVKDPNVKAILKKLQMWDNDENSMFSLKNILTFKGVFSSDTPVAPMLSEQEIKIINNYVNTIKNYEDASIELMVIQKTVAGYGGSLGIDGTGAANLDYLNSSAKAIKSEITRLQADNNSLTITTAEKTAKVAGLETQLQNLNATIELRKEAAEATKELLDNLQSKLEDVQSLIANSAFISAGLAGSVFVLLLIGIYLLKRSTFSDNSLSTLKTVLALRKKIDALRKNTLLSFPELKVQFTFIDSEVVKCEQDSTRKNDILQAYQCSMKYFMGSYALILYAAFTQLSKDGTNVNNFNRLSEIHNYKGFASLTTRRMLEELNSFYDLMIDYDKTLVDSFESVFYFIKKQVLENRNSDNMIKSLPYNLAMGKN